MNFKLESLKKYFISALILSSLILTVVISRNISKTKSVSYTSRAQTPQNQTTPPISAYDAAFLLTDELVKKTSDYHKNAKDAKFEQPLQEIVNRRKEKIRQLIRENPREALKIILHKEVKKLLPDSVQNSLESEIEEEGELEVFHADDFEKMESKDTLFFKSKSGRFELHVTDKDSLPLRTGVKLKIKGVRLDSDIAVDNEVEENLQILTTNVQGVTNPVVKKIAVFLINFTNDTRQPYPVEEVKGTVFTNERSDNSYYNEVSYGAWKFEGVKALDGDVFGYYTVPYTNDNCSGMYANWTQSANDMAVSQGVDINAYNNRVYFFISGRSCPGAGWAYINSDIAWVNGLPSLNTIGHELGHNFGAHHATMLKCYDSDNKIVPFSTNCTVSEYGDTYDIMGMSTNNRHMNSYFRGMLGSLEPSNTQTVTASGNYTLNSIEFNSSAVQSVRIPLPSTPQYYYLEFRQPYGLFDNFSLSDPGIQGVFIRKANDYAMYNKTYVYDLDPQAGSLPNPIKVGQTFEDLGKGIRVRTESVSSTASVAVELFPPICVRSSPKVTLYPQSFNALPGDSKIIQVSLTNLDNSTCGSSSFTVSPSVPGGWSANPSFYTATLNPGASVIPFFTITVSQTTPSGTYQVLFNVAHGADSSFNKTETAVFYVTASTTPTPTLPVFTPTPTPGSDTTPPTVAITFPQNNSTVARRVKLTITATATDASGVSKTEFYVNGSLKCTDLTTPYSCVWSVPSKPRATYTIEFRAFDTKNNLGKTTVKVTSSR